METHGRRFQCSIVPSLSYNVKEAMKLRGEGKLIPFVKDVHRWEIRIIHTWRRHFEELGIPYIVTCDEGVYRLWKEKRI